MQYVFVFDKNKKPLDPCHPARARQILKEKRATVFRRYPFTILLKGRELKESVTYAHQVKFDPDSRTTGIALVREGTRRCFGQVNWHTGDRSSRTPWTVGKPFGTTVEAENAATDRRASITAGGWLAGCLPAWKAG